MPVRSLVLLDTNILVHLIRASAVGTRANDTFQLTARPERPLISVATVGEIQSLARKFGWGDAKRDELDARVRQLVVVDPSQGDIISKYAEIDFYCEKVCSPARPMSQNDMWIAATASATGATLITTDSDFDHLAPTFIQLVRLHAKTGDVIAR